MEKGISRKFTGLIRVQNCVLEVWNGIVPLKLAEKVKCFQDRIELQCLANIFDAVSVS